MTALAMAAAAGGRSICRLSGSLSASGTGVGTLTGGPVTVTVPAIRTGNLKFTSVVNAGTLLQYKKNSGSFTNITEGLVVAFASTDTITVQGTGIVAPNSSSFNILDGDTLALIQSVGLTKTA